MIIMECTKRTRSTNANSQNDERDTKRYYDRQVKMLEGSSTAEEVTTEGVTFGRILLQQVTEKNPMRRCQSKHPTSRSELGLKMRLGSVKTEIRFNRFQHTPNDKENWVSKQDIT